MIDFLLTPQNLPFTVALAVMVAIALMEGVGLLVGVGISSVFDSMIPSIDLDGIDLPEISNATGMTKFLGWLRIGQVPVLITLILCLTIFGLTGFILQSMVHSASGTFLPGPLAVVPAILVTLPTLRITHKLVAKIIPKDETYAVGEATFIGRIAVITNGTATPERAAQARLRDEHGGDHYVMVKPDVEGETLPVGTSVLLVTRNGGIFNAIKNPNPNLVDPLP